MKNRILLPLFAMALMSTTGYAQHKCATDAIRQHLEATIPDFAANRAHYLEHARMMAANRPRLKTTVDVYTIPTVFHVILTQAKINTCGGTGGLIQRAIDQLNVMNLDYNHQNVDISSVPSSFQSVTGTTSIKFGLAHRDPNGAATNGVDIKVTTIGSFSSSGTGSAPKFTSNGGTDTWDPTRYFNIWIVDITESGVLGYTIPPSYNMPSETGVVLDYGCWGKRGGTIQFFSPSVNDLGRTSTHETGHYFDLDHTFGNNSACPGSGDIDDGFSDTPPQGNYTYNSNYSPTYMPPFPLTDSCSPNSPGIMWMNFMDYTDDASMYMFTQQQSTHMYDQVAPGGPMHSLTQHPELLEWPTGIADINEQSFEMYPNPTAGRFTLTVNTSAKLQRITILNTIGQVARVIEPGNSSITNYDVDLTALDKGVYIVQCTFAAGTVTRKIVLQ